MKCHKEFVWAVLLFMCLPAAAEDTALDAANIAAPDLGDPKLLQAKPGRCIALHQGQACFQKIVLRWSTPAPEEYCLIEHSSDSEIVCWQGLNMSRYKHAFESAHDETYLIRHKSSGAIVAHTRITVAWVYKRSKNVTTGWRLF